MDFLNGDHKPMYAAKYLPSAIIGLAWPQPTHNIALMDEFILKSWPFAEIKSCFK